MTLFLTIGMHRHYRNDSDESGKKDEEGSIQYSYCLGTGYIEKAGIT